MIIRECCDLGTKISFGGLLTCIFIALKLMGVIQWHWVLVLAPLLIPYVIIIGIAIILGILQIFGEDD